MSLLAEVIYFQLYWIFGMQNVTTKPEKYEYAHTSNSLRPREVQSVESQEVLLFAFESGAPQFWLCTASPQWGRFGLFLRRSDCGSLCATQLLRPTRFWWRHCAAVKNLNRSDPALRSSRWKSGFILLP